MSRRLGLFNGILVLTLAVCCTACVTKRKKEYSSFRVHLESAPGSFDRASAITVYRSAPMQIAIDREPLLDESHVRSATVVEQPVGFAVQIELNRRGAWLLEGASVSHRGRHLAIFSQFGPARWLGAPEITGHNRSGRLVFTPDATRQEAERFVRGLSNTVYRIERKENWPFNAPFER